MSPAAMTGDDSFHASRLAETASIEQLSSRLGYMLDKMLPVDLTMDQPSALALARSIEPLATVLEPQPPAGVQQQSLEDALVNPVLQQLQRDHSDAADSLTQGLQVVVDNQALSQEALDTLLRSSRSTADLQANRAEVTSLWQEQQQGRTESVLTTVQAQHEGSLRILSSLAKDAEQQRSQLSDCLASVAKLAEAVVEQGKKVEARADSFESTVAGLAAGQLKVRMAADQLSSTSKSTTDALEALSSEVRALRREQKKSQELAAKSDVAAGLRGIMKELTPLDTKSSQGMPRRLQELDKTTSAFQMDLNNVKHSLRDLPSEVADQLAAIIERSISKAAKEVLQAAQQACSTSSAVDAAATPASAGQHTAGGAATSAPASSTVTQPPLPLPTSLPAPSTTAGPQQMDTSPASLPEGPLASPPVSAFPQKRTPPQRPPIVWNIASSPAAPPTSTPSSAPVASTPSPTPSSQAAQVPAASSQAADSPSQARGAPALNEALARARAAAAVANMNRSSPAQTGPAASSSTPATPPVPAALHGSQSAPSPSTDISAPAVGSSLAAPRTPSFGLGPFSSLYGFGTALSALGSVSSAAASVSIVAPSPTFPFQSLPSSQAPASATSGFSFGFGAASTFPISEPPQAPLSSQQPVAPSAGSQFNFAAAVSPSQASTSSVFPTFPASFGSAASTAPSAQTAAPSPPLSIFEPPSASALAFPQQQLGGRAPSQPAFAPSTSAPPIGGFTFSNQPAKAAPPASRPAAVGKPAASHPALSFSSTAFGSSQPAFSAVQAATAAVPATSALQAPATSHQARSGPHPKTTSRPASAQTSQTSHSLSEASPESSVATQATPNKLSSTAKAKLRLMRREQGAETMASNNILQSQRERCCQICRLRFDNELAALRHLSSNLHAAFTAELKADLKKRRTETPLEVTMKYKCAVCNKGKDMKVMGLAQHEEGAGHARNLARKLRELAGDDVLENPASSQGPPLPGSPRSSFMGIVPASEQARLGEMIASLEQSTARPGMLISPNPPFSNPAPQPGLRQSGQQGPASSALPSSYISGLFSGLQNVAAAVSPAQPAAARNGPATASEPPRAPAAAARPGQAAAVSSSRPQEQPASSTLQSEESCQEPGEIPAAPEPPSLPPPLAPYTIPPQAPAATPSAPPAPSAPVPPKPAQPKPSPAKPTVPASSGPPKPAHPASKAAKPAAPAAPPSKPAKPAAPASSSSKSSAVVVNVPKPTVPQASKAKPAAAAKAKPVGERPAAPEPVAKRPRPSVMAPARPAEPVRPPQQHTLPMGHPGRPGLSYDEPWRRGPDPGPFSLRDPGFPPGPYEDLLPPRVFHHPVPGPMYPRGPPGPFMPPPGYFGGFP